MLYEQEKLARERQAQTALVQCYTTLWQFHRRGDIHTTGTLPFIHQSQQSRDVLSLDGKVDIEFFPQAPITRNDAIGYGMINAVGGYDTPRPMGFSNKIHMALAPSEPEYGDGDMEWARFLYLDLHANFRYPYRWQRYLPKSLLMKLVRPIIEATSQVRYTNGGRFELIRSDGIDELQLRYVLRLRDNIDQLAERIAKT